MEFATGVPVSGRILHIVEIHFSIEIAFPWKTNKPSEALIIMGHNRLKLYWM